MTQSPPTVPIALPVTDRPNPRPPRFGLVAVASALAYAALSVGVKVGLPDGVDGRLAQLGRPDDGWQARQQLFSHVPADFGPEQVGTALITLMLLVLVVRRQWKLVLVAGLAVGFAGSAAAVTKLVLGRADVQGIVNTLSSYPSGHTVSATVCAGLALLLMWPSPRWWHLTLPLVPAVGMGISLVIIGMHWATDALGGALLGLAVLATVAWWQARRAR